MEIIGPVSLYIIIVLGVVGSLACLIDKNAQKLHTPVSDLINSLKKRIASYSS